MSALHDIIWLIIGTQHLLHAGMSRLSSCTFVMHQLTAPANASSCQEDMPHTAPSQSSSCLHRA
jgi:hypothetical protein